MARGMAKVVVVVLMCWTKRLNPVRFKPLTCGCLMNLKLLVAFSLALLVNPSWAADFTWDKFGYALLASTHFYSSEPLVSTPPAACNAPASRPLSYCFDAALLQSDTTCSTTDGFCQRQQCAARPGRGV